MLVFEIFGLDYFFYRHPIFLMLTSIGGIFISLLFSLICYFCFVVLDVVVIGSSSSILLSSSDSMGVESGILIGISVSVGIPFVLLFDCEF